MNPDSESRLDRMERMIESMRARRAEADARRAKAQADAAKAELRYKSDMAWIRRVTRIAEKVLGEETSGNV